MSKPEFVKDMARCVIKSLSSSNGLTAQNEEENLQLRDLVWQATILDVDSETASAIRREAIRSLIISQKVNQECSMFCWKCMARNAFWATTLLMALLFPLAVSLRNEAIVPELDLAIKAPFVSWNAEEWGFVFGAITTLWVIIFGGAVFSKMGASAIKHNTYLLAFALASVATSITCLVINANLICYGIGMTSSSLWWTFLAIRKYRRDRRQVWV